MSYAMNPSRIFIERPVATSLMMLALFLSGLVAYFLMPVSSLPEVDYPTFRVFTYYPGASPDVMATIVTAPLERQFGEMASLNQMTSTSSNGSSMITLQFGLDASLDVAEQEVQAAINAASGNLPQDLPYPPVYSKVNPADAPVLTVALTSETMPLSQVEDYADTRLVQKISQLSGVGLVSISGGQRPAIRIQVNPDAIASYGLTLEDIRNAISTATVNSAKGNFDGPQLAYSINANDQLLNADQYRSLIIAYKQNAPIRLANVANVENGVENVYQSAWANQKPAVILSIQRQPGANVIDVVEHIKQLLLQQQNLMPKAIKMSILNDRTQTIRASISDVQFELTLAIALVVLIIFVFLRKLSATVIPGLAVIISLVGALGVMYLLNLGLNNLTLMALTIATGFVVDDAIVMIENISRFIEMGEDPLKAALKGSEQIGFTILSLTVSLIAVLIPLLFMGDVIGRLFREFAITVAITIVFSAIVSLTLTPMMCARMLHHQKEKSKSLEKNDSLFNRWIDFYRASLEWIFEHQWKILGCFLATVAVTLLLVIYVPKGLFPQQDVGAIQVVTDAAENVSFNAMVLLQKQVEESIQQDPDVASVASFIGIDGTNLTLNVGRMLVTLKPLSERHASAVEIARRLQTNLAHIPNMSVYTQAQQDLTIDDRVSRTQFQYTVSSPYPDQVSQWSAKLLKELQVQPELEDVASDQLIQGLATQINFDRDTAARLGVNLLLFDQILYDAFGQRQIATLFTQRNQYHVVLEISPTLSQNPAALNHLYFISNQGQTIPFSALTQVSQSFAPLTIQRQEQFPVTTLSFNLSPGYSLSQAIAAIHRVELALKLPLSIQTSFEGAARAFQDSLQNEGWLVLAAILVVYIVLGVLYESFIHPLTILSTLPSAGLGALLALLLTGGELNMIALIGMILLIGIVMKNAIMMIDFALEQERVFQKSAQDAIFEAALLRFRPILMTSLAAVFSAVPLAFSHSMGSELRRPLGVVILSGLLMSQLMTLYTTPVIYVAFDRGFRALKKKWAQGFLRRTPEA